MSETCNIDDINNSIYKIIEAIPKRVIEEDNETLNTIDYDKEEKESKHQTIEIGKINIKDNSFIEPKIQRQNSKNEKERKGSKPHKKNISNIKRKKNIKKEKNLESMKQNEDVKINNDCCSRCKKDFTSSLKACPHCSSLFCKLCLKEIFGNENIKNINLNEKNCPNCINLTSLQSFSTVFINKKKKNSQISQEPLDTCEEEDPKIENQFTEEKIIKDLDEQSKGFEALISKIENKKKSIEAQKNIGIWIYKLKIQAIEVEYERNLEKLNNMISSIKKIIESIDTKKENFNSYQLYSNPNAQQEIEKIFDGYKKNKSDLNNNYDKLIQKISRNKEKSFKIHESRALKVNISDTYCMKYKEIMSKNNIGKAYLKINKFVNNYTNCLHFSVLFKQDENLKKGTRPNFIVMIDINDKLVKLFKNNKDVNESTMSYECTFSENKLFFVKNKAKSDNQNNTNEELNVKVYINELMI